MPIFTTSARQVILTIGNSKSRLRPWGELPLVELTRYLRNRPIKGKLRETIDWLKEHDLVSEESSKSSQRLFSLTHKGFRVYSAILYEGGLTMPYDHIGVRTFLSADLEKELGFVENFFVTWSGNFVQSLGDDLRDYGQDSIFLCYVALQSSPFDWLAHSLFYGAYDVVLRELRSTLEGLFVAYNLDTQNNGKSLDEKLNAMTDLEKCGKGHGIAVFKSSGISDWKKYYSVYTELCGYVHSTRQITGHRIWEVAQLGIPQLIEPEFRKDNFIQCVSIWRKVGNAAVDLANELIKFYKVDDSFGYAVFDEV